MHLTNVKRVPFKTLSRTTNACGGKPWLVCCFWLLLRLLKLTELPTSHIHSPTDRTRWDIETEFAFFKTGENESDGTRRKSA